MSDYKDTVIALDDLPKSDSPAVQRERKELVARALRFVANGSKRQTAAKDKSAAEQICRAGGVFTGEISLNAASDITRMLKVPLDRHKKCGVDSDRGDAATAFRMWMSWLLPHLDQELGDLKVRLAQNRDKENARLEATGILFMWVMKLFCRFLDEKGFVGEDYCQEMLAEADSIIGTLLTAQAEETANIRSQAPEGNLSYYILKGYRDHCFQIVSREKLIHDREKYKNKEDQEKVDKYCLVEKDALCIRVDTLLEYLRKQANFGHLTKRGMTQKLDEEGVLPDTQEGRGPTKKVKGKRYLELSIAALKAASRKY